MKKIITLILMLLCIGTSAFCFENPIAKFVITTVVTNGAYGKKEVKSINLNPVLSKIKNWETEMFFFVRCIENDDFVDYKITKEEFDSLKDLPIIGA